MEMKGKLLAYSFAAYLLSAMWVLLFPLVSISTSESKPRGLYVDENALVVEAIRSSNQVLPPKFPPIQSSSGLMDIDRLCLTLILEGISQCKRADSGYVTEIIIDAVDKVLSTEATLIALPYLKDFQGNELGIFENDDARERQAARLAFDISSSLLQSSWLSKRVIILLIPYSCKTYGYNDQFNNVLSYIEDNKDLCIRRDNDNDNGNDNTGARHSEPLSRWLENYHSISDESSHAGLIREAYVLDMSEIDSREENLITKPSYANVRVVGSNGNLPNMDLLSSVLSLFPDSLRSAYISYKEGVNNNSYLGRLFGLGNFWASQIVGPDGLHAQFLSWNIDALSISPNSEDFMFLEVLLLLIRSSSNLHEELHHSHFFYLLQGSASFVDISEYAPTMFLVLIPLMTIYFDLTKSNTKASLVEAFILIIMDFLIPIVIVICIILFYNRQQNNFFLQIGMCSIYTANLFYTFLIGKGWVKNGNIKQSYICIVTALLVIGIVWLGAHFYTLAFIIAIIFSPIMYLCLFVKANSKILWILRATSLVFNPLFLCLLYFVINGDTKKNIVLSDDWIITKSSLILTCFLGAHTISVVSYRCFSKASQ
jgi:hypothetical protein